MFQDEIKRRLILKGYCPTVPVDAEAIEIERHLSILRRSLATIQKTEFQAKMKAFDDPLDDAFEAAYAKGWRETETIPPPREKEAEEAQESCGDCAEGIDGTGGSGSWVDFHGSGSLSFPHLAQETSLTESRREANHRDHILAGLQVVVLLGVRAVLAAKASAGDESSSVFQESAPCSLNLEQLVDAFETVRSKEIRGQSPGRKRILRGIGASAATLTPHGSPSTMMRH